MKVQNVKNSTVSQLIEKGATDSDCCANNLVSDLASDLNSVREERDYLKKLLREHIADLSKDATGRAGQSEDVKEYAKNMLERWNKRAAYHKVNYAVVDVDELSAVLTNDARAYYASRF